MASERQFKDFNFDFGTGRQAVLGLVVTVPRPQWDAYFERMKVFAKENDLKIRIARLKPGHDIFFVDLWRTSAMVTGGNVFDDTEFQVHVYIDPDKGGSKEMADSLVEGMKQAVAEIPGVTVKERE